jgi:DNA-binding NarL/FixJ family response regulator
MASCFLYKRREFISLLGGAAATREFEILRMILEARTTDEIASAFHVSRKTVANYHYNIKSKLGVSSDIELLYYGLQHGVITPIAPLRLDLEK